MTQRLPASVDALERSTTTPQGARECETAKSLRKTSEIAKHAGRAKAASVACGVIAAPPRSTTAAPSMPRAASSTRSTRLRPSGPTRRGSLLPAYRPSGVGLTWPSKPARSWRPPDFTNPAEECEVTKCATFCDHGTLQVLDILTVKAAA